MRSTLAVLCVMTLAMGLPAEDPPTALPAELTTRLGQLLERDWDERPPWAEMAINILKGGRMGSGHGWYTGSLRRHDWKWLEETFDEAAADGRIERDEIRQLDKASFDAIDHDGDKSLTPADFQFTKNPFMEDNSPAGDIFSRLDIDSNGRLTMNELERWFKRSADGSDFLSVDDLKGALGLNPKQPRGKKSKEPAADPRWNMMRLLLNGELGSFSEGPDLGAEAPELDLPLVAHRENGGLELTDRIVRLADVRGKKPVVLIFGSFT